MAIHLTPRKTKQTTNVVPIRSNLFEEFEQNHYAGWDLKIFIREYVFLYVAHFGTNKLPASSCFFPVETCVDFVGDGLKIPASLAFQKEWARNPPLKPEKVF